MNNASNAGRRFNPFDLGRLLQRLQPDAEGGPRIAVRRPEDHLVFELLFDNLRIDAQAGQAARLVRNDAARRGVLIVEFPPQSFGEESFTKTSPGLEGKLSDELPPRPGGLLPGASTIAKQDLEIADAVLPAELPISRIRMAGPSRLAFTMPADVTALPYTLASVLSAMREWPMRLDRHAVDDEAQRLHVFGHALDSLALRDALVKHVPADQRLPLVQAIVGAGRRIAELAAGGLPEDSAGVIANVAWSGLRAESAALVARHPALRNGDLHTATIGALALETAATLASMAGVTAEGKNVVFDRSDQLPYLALLAGQPHPPSASTTALELPYRLMLSPIGAASWQHGLVPATSAGRTELWHTRLGNPAPATGVEPAARVRALWSPDLDAPAVSDITTPFRMSLDAQDRRMLVMLMAQWMQERADGKGLYLPQSSQARRLHLSSLGALLDAGGDWDVRPAKVDLEQWRHLATLGRDHYVRVVYAGYLIPFGHPASLVKVTERHFETLNDDPAQRVAVLRQRFFLIVREPLQTYPASNSRHAHGGRNFPFRSIEILTRVTPNLDPPNEIPASGALYTTQLKNAKGNLVRVTKRMAFWPRIDDRDYRFEIAATDRDGERSVFSLPMLFVSEIVDQTASALACATKAYNDTLLQLPDASRVQADLGGAGLRFDAQPGDSRLTTRSMSFQAGPLTDSAAASPVGPHFHPEMRETEICVPALQKLLGRNEPITMRYPKIVIEGGANAGQLYLQTAGNAHALNFGGGAAASQTDAIGGLAAPQMSIIGVSKRSGPVSAPPGLVDETTLKEAIANQFDPAKFFSPEATLIGGIKLVDLLAGLPLPALDSAQAPRLLARALPEGAPNRIESSFEWTTPLSGSGPAGLLIPNASGPTTLAMRGMTSVPLDGTGSVTREAHASIDNFKLDLFGFIIVWFDRLAFDSLPGHKPDVTLQLHGDEAVKFGGALEFVNELRRFIPSNGFSDPPSLSVTPSGIAAGYSLSLPSVPLGIFDLSNVTIGAAFSLPFDNRPVSLRFNFSERQQPFSLTVSASGGGGFFAIAIGADGVQEIEAALEFGAAVALNLVVASGIVEIKAGIYFNWLDNGTNKLVKLSGYLRIHGEMTVLGIASASVTFNLQLGFVKDEVAKTSTVFGEAELVVEIEVLFLSKSVSVHCRREFSGGPADPKFIDLIPSQSDWDDYCACFAPETV